MTDNEVIKALEEMADYPHYYEEGQILKNALDIINRLKDNERKYRAKVQSQRYEINCNQKNIERYKGVIKILEKDIAKAKSEAVKEFADRLSEMQNRMVDRYDAEDKEIPDICEIKLRESGINVDELLKEG